MHKLILWKYFDNIKLNLLILKLSLSLTDKDNLIEK